MLFVDQKDPWDPAPAVRERVFKMLDESHRWVHDSKPEPGFGERTWASIERDVCSPGTWLQLPYQVLKESCTEYLPQ